MHCVPLSFQHFWLHLEISLNDLKRYPHDNRIYILKIQFPNSLAFKDREAGPRKFSLNKCHKNYPKWPCFDWKRPCFGKFPWKNTEVIGALGIYWFKRRTESWKSLHLRPACRMNALAEWTMREINSHEIGLVYSLLSFSSFTKKFSRNICEFHEFHEHWGTLKWNLQSRHAAKPSKWA